MKRKLHFIATACLFAACLGTASAQDEKTKLQALGPDGEVLWSSALADFKWVTFPQGNSVAFIGRNGADVLYSTQLAGVSKIVFISPTSGIGDLTSEAGNTLRLVNGGNRLSITGWTPGTTGHAAIYAVSGQLLWSDAGWNGADINVANLPQGIYILKIDTQSFKFRKS